jgi:hypothetical protein
MHANEELADLLREDGDGSFLQHCYPDAVNLYTARHCRTSPHLHRSAALLTLEIYSIALLDPDEALWIESSHLKARHRKKTVLLCLQHPKEAKDVSESLLCRLYS